MKLNLRTVFVVLALAACGVLLLCLAHDAPSGAELRVMEYADAYGLDYAEYPESLVGLLESNPEAAGFVLDYPFREETGTGEVSFDLTRGVPLFLQFDQRWGYLPYGGDYVGVSGSEAMCIAMAGYYLSGGDEKFTPAKVVEFAGKKGYGQGENGSDWVLLTDGAPELGLKVTGLSRAEKKIAAYLDGGTPIIASMGGGDFINGQFIVITGYEDGTVTINDPCSWKRSQVQWDFDTLTKQARSLWAVQKKI